MSITTRQIDEPAAQPDISAVMDLKTREIVHVTVSGPTGSGKSAICGLIVYALRRAAVDVAWVGGLDEIMVADAEHRSRALLMYQPSVKLHEANVSRVKKDYSAETTETLGHGLFWLAQEPRGIDAADLLCGAADRLSRLQREVGEVGDQIADLQSDLHNANQDRKELTRANELLRAEVQRFRADRAYTVGVNDGYEAAQEQATERVLRVAVNANCRVLVGYDEAGKFIAMGDITDELERSRLESPLVLKPAGSQEWCDMLALTIGSDDSGSYRCGPVATILAQILSLLGYPATICFGTVGDVGHVWVEVDGVVYDPTAAQFDEPVYEKSWEKKPFDDRDFYTPQPRATGVRKTSADYELIRLDEVRRIITAIATEFDGRIVEKPALADALLATITFLQGADYVRDWVQRGGRTKYQAHHDREAATANGLTEVSLSAETLAKIRETVLGVRF